MGFRLNFAEVSSWSLTSIGDSATASVAIPGVSLGSKFGLAAGGGGGWVEVTSSKHKGDVYRCYFTFVTIDVSAGVSLLGVVSVSGAPSTAKSAGSPIFRTGPFSPDGSGEGGDPTGLLGPCFLLTGSGGGTVGGYASLMVMGPPHGWKEKLAASVLPAVSSQKYMAGMAGVQVSAGFSVGVSAQPGIIHTIVNRHRGNTAVRFGGASTLRQPVKDMP
jgi:hypothetical protein